MPLRKMDKVCQTVALPHNPMSVPRLVALAMEAGTRGRIASPWWTVGRVVPHQPPHPPFPEYPILPVVTDIHQARQIQLRP